MVVRDVSRELDNDLERANAWKNDDSERKDCSLSEAEVK
jgi:hypothetical protein